MGNSHFEGGSLHLVFENTFHSPGGNVIGEAQLRLSQPYPGKRMLIEVAGVESYFESGSGDDSDTSIKKEFYKEAFGVSLGTSSIIPVGSHRYNFNFRLRQGLPPSLHTHKGSRTLTIKYEIVARISDERGKYPSIKYKSPFLVSEDVPRASNLNRAVT